MAAASLSVSGLAFADLVFAGNQSAVSATALKFIEDATNKQFAPEPSDSWEQLGDARGSYLPGYGAVFTFEMTLVSVMPITPFHVEVTAQEIKSVHARKLKKLPVLKSAMRDLMVKAATSLTSLPPAEQITFEAFLDNFSFEDRTGLPRRLTLTASRQKILDAVMRHASPEELTALIEEREEQ
jgi:hypothetical protein